MTRKRIAWAPGWFVVLALGAGVCVGLQAQARSVEQLRTDLADRYTVAPVQGGVALVPRRADAGVRIIEIVDGVIQIDGDRVTGRELQQRLARDADLILQVSYLGRDDLARLTGAPAAGVAGEIAPPPPQAEGIVRRDVRRGDVVRIGGSVTIGRDERVEGDVVVVFGSANVNGEIEGEVTVVMGSLNLGADAVVQDDVTVIGGRLNREEGSRVLGSVEEVAVGGGDFRRGRDDDFDLGFGNPFRTFWSRMGNFVGTTLRLTLMVLFALVAVALARTSVERIADKTANDPLRSGFVGLLAELLFIPLLVAVIVVLAVSIVGIPLLVLVPFGILAVGVLMVVGYSGLAYQLGRSLVSRFGWGSGNGFLPVALGVVAIMALTLIARLAALAIGTFAPGLTILGYVVEYLAWTVGFGAALLAWFGARQQRSNSGPGLMPESPLPPLPSQP